MLFLVAWSACASPSLVQPDTQDTGGETSSTDTGAPLSDTPHDTGTRQEHDTDTTPDTVPGDTASPDSADTTMADDAQSNPDMADDVQDEPDTSTPDTSEPDTSEEPEAAHLPTRYPADAVHSPINAYVAANLQAIADLEDRQNQVFMKVGASSTVNTNTLFCLATDDTHDLDGREELEPTLAFFRQGDAAGTTPFDRPTEAALSGRSAGWAMDGDPSPLDQEIAAIDPRYALLHYGTNDMQLGTTYASALYVFADRYLRLVEMNQEQGIVPLLFTIFPRGDRAEADRWVNTYNAVIRGVGQGLQVPVVDVHRAVLPLPDRGLSSDGIHPNVYRSGGQSRACIFTPDGLQYGFNVRNLVTLEALHRLRLAVAEELPPDREGIPIPGDGSPDAPIVIEELPFTHMADTRESPHRNLDRYSGCNANQNESGPEILYRLQLDTEARLRFMLFDQGEVDIDLHILDASATEEGCLARNHQILQGRLPAGTYHLALDTFVSNAGTVFE
ncbi:MAG: SGNH/GDSL hydrolase family protein, partial [Myxococcota bacterium]